MILNSVPKIYQKKADILIELLDKQRNILNWNQRGEIAYKNQPIKNSNIADLFHYIFTLSSKSNPRGKSEFINALDDLNIPNHFIKNKHIVKSYVVEQEKLTCT